ncbi:MAG: response regulator [Anaerolineae bacterium]|nr:response regulator [Anaerolineae bacterium]
MAVPDVADPLGGADSVEAALAGEGRPWDALQGTLTVATASAAGLGYLGLVSLIVAHQSDPQWRLYLAPAVLFTGGAVGLASRRPYRLRAALLILTLFAACLVANTTTDWPYAPLLYPTPVLLAGVLLGPAAAGVYAALATLALLRLPVPDRVHALAALGLLWLHTGIVWAAVGNLFRTVWRSQRSEERAWQQARATSLRRGELARAKKALSDMYGLLERTNYELAVARQEADEARQIKAQFAANISHELRTPLNLIVGFSEMMYRSPEVYGNVRWPPALSADIREIHRASRHLLGMIDDILDLSRIEAQRLPLRLEPTDITELVRDVAATAGGLLRGKEASLRVETPERLPEVLVDRTRIRQVMLNLVNNAVRFTDVGEIAIVAEARDGEVSVAVSDTGVGIPPGEIPGIFEEFGQASDSLSHGRGGAGLGLAICRQFVRLHGGHIEAESEVGRGSTFRFFLPLPDSGRALSRLSYYAPEGWSPRVPENPLGRTALLLGPRQAADAEGASAEAVPLLARRIEGYRVLPVESLDLLAARVEAEHPEGIIVLTDPLLGDRFEAEAIWRAAGRADLPIIRCELPLEAEAKRHLGVADYLVKPVERTRLLGAIQKVAPHPGQILVVDDDPGFVALIGRMIGAGFPGARLRRAYSGEEALAALQEGLDLVILDLIMADVSGLDVIEAMRQDERLARVPVIVTTGSGYGEEVAQTRPARIELLLRAQAGRAQLSTYVKALLEAAPPDYSRPAPP